MAEGDCLGIPYATDLVYKDGCRACFWYGTEYDETRLQKALEALHRTQDVGYVIASPGAPRGYSTHQDILK